MNYRFLRKQIEGRLLNTGCRCLSVLVMMIFVLIATQNVLQAKIEKIVFGDDCMVALDDHYQIYEKGIDGINAWGKIPVARAEMVDIATGVDHLIALDRNGVVYARGEWAHPFRGKANLARVDIPQRVTKIFAMGDLSYAVTVSGDVWVWGNTGVEEWQNRIRKIKGIKAFDLALKPTDMVAYDIHTIYCWSGMNVVAHDADELSLPVSSIKCDFDIKQVLSAGDFLFVLDTLGQIWCGHLRSTDKNQGSFERNFEPLKTLNNGIKRIASMGNVLLLIDRYDRLLTAELSLSSLMPVKTMMEHVDGMDVSHGFAIVRSHGRLFAFGAGDIEKYDDILPYTNKGGYDVPVLLKLTNDLSNDQNIVADEGVESWLASERGVLYFSRSRMLRCDDLSGPQWVSNGNRIAYVFRDRDHLFVQSGRTMELSYQPWLANTESRVTLHNRVVKARVANQRMFILDENGVLSLSKLKERSFLKAELAPKKYVGTLFDKASQHFDGIADFEVYEDWLIVAGGDGKVSFTTLSDEEISSELTELSGLDGVIKVWAGAAFCLAMDVEGQLWGHGENARGQLAQGDTRAVSGWLRIPKIGRPRQVACGTEHVLLLDDQKHLWAWGGNNFNQCVFDDESVAIVTPTSLDFGGADPVSHISAYGDSSFASNSFQIFSWGKLDHSWESEYSKVFSGTDFRVYEINELSKK